MNWSTLPPHIRTATEQQLTSKQLDVLVLHLAGCSQRRIATMLNVSRTTVRDHLAVGLDTIATLTRKDAA